MHKLVAWVLSRLFSINTLALALKMNGRVVSLDVVYSEDLLDMEATFYERSRASENLDRIVH